MAKNDSEALFFEMLRSLVLTIGWVFSAIFTLLGILIDEVNNLFHNSQERKRKENEAEGSRKTLEGPHGETAALEAQATSVIQKAAFPNADQFSDDFFERYIRDRLKSKTMLAWGIRHPMLDSVYNVYTAESFDRPPSRLVVTGQIEAGRYRDELIAHVKKLSDPGKTLAVITRCMIESCNEMTKRLPPIALQHFDEPDAEPDEVMSIPFMETVNNPKEIIVESILPYFAPEAVELGLFKMLRKRLDANSKNADEELTERSPAREIVSALLKGTELEPIFIARVGFQLPAEQRYSGHWIIAPPGRGKTTLLHTMVMEDLKKDAAVILMDSKGDLIEPFRDLKQIEDRLIIVDPDPNHPIAINPLDIPKSDISLAIAHLEYIFSSLLESKMTPLQTVLFRSVLRALITSFPDPTLETFRDILTNGIDRYKEYIAQLPQDLQDFFAKEFNTKIYEDRRKEIIWRLRLLLENDTMRAMMLALRTRFSIGDAIDQGKVIIINNSKARLGDQGSEFFGRFFIAQVLAAAQQRSGRRSQDKKPVYFYIDECQNVIARDERIPTILDECRSQKVALILAHQRTEQIISPNVLSALSNCAIRYANSDDEAKFLSTKLRTSPEFLQSLKRGQFAVFVRDMTATAIALNVPRTDFSKHPRLSPDEQQTIRAKMQTEYGVVQSGSPGAVNINPRPPAAEPRCLDSADAPKADEPADTPRNLPPKKKNNPDAEPGSDGSPSW